MLENIFLIAYEICNGEIHAPPVKSRPIFKSKSYLAYPDEEILESSPDLVESIIQSQASVILQSPVFEHFTEDFLYKHAKALDMHNRTLLVVPLPHNHILGLVFDRDKETNPLDYRNELIRLLFDYILEKYFRKISNSNTSQTTLLLTLFVDLRKYTDESLLFHPSVNAIQFYRGQPFVKVFVYGLDYAGKSSLMRLMATGKYDEDFFIPTKKFRITNISMESGVKLSCWDLPGQRIFREDWLRGAQASNLLLFVVDVADSARIDEAKQALWSMLNLFELKNLPLIFLLNKIDLLSQPLKTGDLENYKKLFGLDQIDEQKRNVQVIATSLPHRSGIDLLNHEIRQMVSHLMILNGISDPSSIS